MSGALAIAATSEVLRFIVSDALIKAGTTHDFTAPGVSTGSPPRPKDQAADEAAAVNLFLMQVTPNPAGRNIMGAARDSPGRKLNNAPLILDLHYLLSAHGPAGVREIGLGTALHALHQTGIVPRGLIRYALKKLDERAGADSTLKAIAKDRLADQLESLTITPETLDLDALTKIWTATQVPYRPSVGLLVTTVFLEDTTPVHEPLPAVRAGATPMPVSSIEITSIGGTKDGAPRPITLSTSLVVDGNGFLDGDLGADFGGVALTIVAAGSSANRLVLQFPPDAADTLRCGPNLLRLTVNRVIADRSTRLGVAAAAVVLHPLVTVPPAPPLPDMPGQADRVAGALTVAVSPPVDRTQNVALLLTPLTDAPDHSVEWKVPDPVEPPENSFSELTFQLKGVLKGTYIVRLSVDGTISPALPDNAGDFQPRVTL